MLSSRSLPFLIRKSRFCLPQATEWRLQSKRRASTDQKAVTISFKDRVAIMTMDAGENRFSLPFMQELTNAFDDVLASDALAVVTTGKGKFYSNGLDLPWILERADNEETVLNFMLTFTRLMARILTFPIPTVAALNGHAFAGGGVMALAHDHQIMNSEKGWICLPEVNINVRYGPALCELLKCKVADPKLRSELILFGERYTSAQALQRGLIDAESLPGELVDKSIEFILSNKNLVNGKISRDTLFTLKTELYHSAVKLLVKKPPSLYLMRIHDHRKSLLDLV